MEPIVALCLPLQVLSHLRVHPLNSSFLTATSATASTTVHVTGCSTVRSEAAAFPLAAAAIGQNSNLATQLAPLTLAVQENPLKRVTVYAWNATNIPLAAALTMNYQQTIRAAFTVQYQRTILATGYLLDGTVTIHNINLLEAAALVVVQVELYQPGSSGPVVRAWVDCPRDTSGEVTVPGQLLGSGQLVCTWSMQLLGEQTALFSSNSKTQLIAVAVTSTGLEYLSPAQGLRNVAVSDTRDVAVGACATLSNTFQPVGLGAEVLLQPSSRGPGSSLLAGEGGGGRAADVVCTGLTVAYGATYGPFTQYQCGTHRVGTWL